MWFTRMAAVMLSVALLAGTSAPAASQTTDNTRAATGGAQTLEDILARQKGLKVDSRFRSSQTGSPDAAQPATAPLGTLGGASDADVFRALRYGKAQLTSTVPGELGKVVIQDGGMRWLEFRRGPLPRYGGFALVAVIVLLALFYSIRGRIRLDGKPAGRTIVRFKTLERIGHWSMAIPFVVLALTGLSLTFGRVALIPLLGKPTFSLIAAGGKYLHHYLAWVFMFGLLLSAVLWIWDNIPARHDLKWLMRAGGLLTTGVHPPAGKFNAGEKILFWIVILFGLIVSLTGLSLLFPYSIDIVTPVLGVFDRLGLADVLGFGVTEGTFTPQEQMHIAQLWHAVVAFAFMAVILGHIYIGTIGMEGALDAMTKGEVDIEWAKEHHDLWYEEVVSAASDKSEAKTPAE